MRLTTVMLPDRVSPEEAAQVFRRAAELETAGIRGDSAALLDPDTLEAIGREVGLSPAAIHAALAEFRSGGLREADREFDIVSSRVVPGPPSDVRLSVDELASGNLLAMRRSRGETTVWTRQRGVGRAVVRRLGGRARYPLGAVRELRARVSDHASRPGLVRVRLEARLAYPWQFLPLRTQAVLGAGVGGGAVAFAWGLQHLGTTSGLSAATAVLPLSAFGIGARTYRQAVVCAEGALQLFLDRLALGQPVSARPSPGPAH
jgi:hypothetical protein